MRILTAVIAVLVATGCDASGPDSCKVTCTSDGDCPDGQTCGELGLCTAGEACSCEAGQFLGCDGDSARFCNPSANGIAVESCAAGCNAGAGRCNVCVPDAPSCSGDMGMLEQCGPDGLPGSTSACTLPCVPENAGVAAHCGYLEPLFFPDLCDVPATAPELAASDVTIDTSTDATCNGGILTQTGGPEVCVLRYGTITIGANVLVRGGRAVAFVADTGVLVEGLLDVSADTTSNGPGGGGINGQRAASKKGGGGGGFGTAGGDGGVGDGGKGLAGGVIDPLQNMVFIGGSRPEGPTFSQTNYPIPGGGGGAVMVVACRGEVSVTGTIDAGGGGGQGGRDSSTIVAGAVNFVGGTGGGTGGYVVLQGIEVRVTSPSGGVFANGGGGGAGCPTDNCVAPPGLDALRSTDPAGGGGIVGSGLAVGGNGGGLSMGATGGYGDSNGPGGGGGAVGRLQVCYPAAGSVTITATVSPAFQPAQMISTR